MIPFLRNDITGKKKEQQIELTVLCSVCRAGIDDVETDVVEIEAKLDKVPTHFIQSLRS